MRLLAGYVLHGRFGGPAAVHSELAELVTGVSEASVAPVVSALTERLQAMVTIGLDYLRFGQPLTILSGAEAARRPADPAGNCP